jgi:hypothetical protein
MQSCVLTLTYRRCDNDVRQSPIWKILETESTFIYIYPFFSSYLKFLVMLLLFRSEEKHLY